MSVTLLLEHLESVRTTEENYTLLVVLSRALIPPPLLPAADLLVERERGVIVAIPAGPVERRARRTAQHTRAGLIRIVMRCVRFRARRKRRIRTGQHCGG